MEHSLQPQAKVVLVAQAIARAEGFYVPDSLPQRNNNPGDITDASGKKYHYPSPGAGWNALYRKIGNDIGSYRSRIYSPNMSWRSFGWMWVCGTVPDAPTCQQTPDDWVKIVCNELAVQPTDRTGDFLGV